jgi:hypothetical protein
MAPKVGFTVACAGGGALTYCYLQFTRLDESNTHIINAIDKLDARLDDIDKTLADLNCHVIAMEGKQQLRNWQLGTCAAASLMAAAAAAAAARK